MRGGRSAIAAALSLGLLAGAAFAQPAPPLVTSPQWSVWYQDLLAARLAACPLERPVTFHFSQNGNDQTGDGSLQNPYRSLAKAQAILTATAGNVALLFRRGDVWREPAGLDSNAPGVTIADYGSGAKPLFTAFEVITTPAAWAPTPGTANTYQRPELGVVSWVKEDDDLDWPYSKQGSIAGVEATEGSWYWSGSVLYIHPKHGPGGVATDPRSDGKRYELARPRGSGVIVRGHGSRVQNIRAQAWGLTEQLGTQMHGIESRTQAQDEAVFVGCESHYGLAHVMTHYTGHGGIATFVDCRAGLTTFADGGGETMFNTYAVYGGNQTIFHGCVATHGTLPTFQRIPGMRQGVGFYGHSQNLPGSELGLTISYGCTTRDTPYGCKAPTSFANLIPAPSLADVRCFIVNEVFEGGPTTGEYFQFGLDNAVRINGRYLNMRPPPLGIAALSGRGSGWAINCTVQLDCSDQPINFALYNGNPQGVNDVRIWNSAIHAVAPQGIQFSIDWDFPGQSASASLYNTIISVTGGGTCVPNVGSAGTVAGNAYFGVEPAGYAMDAARVLLAGAPAIGLRPACDSALSCAAVPLPGGVRLWFDQAASAPERNDIGPLESHACGNCDGSTVAPVINVADFICFQQKFAAGDPAANCDGSTVPPALNVADYICFLGRVAAGCR